MNIPTMHQECTCAFFLLNSTDFVQRAASLSYGPWQLTQPHSTGGLCWRKSSSTFYFLGHTQWFTSCPSPSSSKVISGSLLWVPGQENFRHFSLGHCSTWTWGLELQPPSCCQPERKARMWNDCGEDERSHGINSTQWLAPSLTSRYASQWSLLLATLPELDFLFFFCWKHLKW